MWEHRRFLPNRDRALLAPHESCESFHQSVQSQRVIWISSPWATKIIQKFLRREAAFAISNEVRTQFRSCKGSATVSLVSTGFIHGGSSIALFRGCGGRGKFFSRGRQGARCSTFAQPAASKAGSGGRAARI